MSTRNQPGSAGRKGFSLIEMIAVLWGVWAILLISVLLLVAIHKLERSTAASLNRLSNHSALADQFRADVAQASAAPETFGQHKAGPTCLILRDPNGKHLVYRWQEKYLERTEQVGEEIQQQRLDLGKECTGIEFQRTGPEQRLIALKLTEKPSTTAPPRQKEITAALGGDLR